MTQEPVRARKHPLLARPLYAFDLPPQLTHTLQLRTAIDVQDPLSAPAAPPVAHEGEPSTRSQFRVPPCSLCPDCAPFPSVAAQRVHFRSDWHRYNTQLNVQGSSVLVSQPSFEKLADDVESASETDEESTQLKADLITKLLARTHIRAKDTPDDDGADETRGLESSFRTPLLWFTSRPDTKPDDALAETQLGFNRNIFPDPGSALAPALPPGSTASEWYAACLGALQAGRVTRQGGKASAWKGKRIKSKDVQDAAKPMLMTVLDGDGFIPNLKATSSSTLDSDDESDYASSSSGESTAAIGKAPSADPPLRMWTVLLMGGGHFAASVIALNPHITTYRKQPGAPREERALILLAHKAFHRYTTRRKQGGSQAAQDATGRFAKSAGAQLRRYNESALVDDVRGLLDLPGWRELIGRSEKVWIRAGARAAKGMLWAWDGVKASHASPLDPARTDGRLESLPFPTRRPTIGETVRCFLELSRVKIEHKTDAELLAEEERERETATQRQRKQADVRRREEKTRERQAELERAKAEKALAQPRLTDAEQATRALWERLIDMVRKGRVEALATFLGKNEQELLSGDIDAVLPAWWLQQEAQEAASASKLVPRTLLQLAAEGGSEASVRYLLEERRADPTVAAGRVGAIRADGVDAPHRTAYDLCSTKEARNVFRRLMADHADWADWGGMGVGGARVPSALTEEMQESQSSKQKDRRAALRDKARERADKAAEKQASQPSEPPAPTPQTSHHSTNRLGGAGAAPRALLQHRDEQQGLTPEIRARIEREKRARAAEERIKALR